MPDRQQTFGQRFRRAFFGTQDRPRERGGVISRPAAAPSDSVVVTSMSLDDDRQPKLKTCRNCGEEIRQVYRRGRPFEWRHEWGIACEPSAPLREQGWSSMTAQPRESDLPPQEHDGCIGPDCPICANPSHFPGVWKQRRESPEPDVTRNAMSPDELWATQEKPRVSDDAPDMGPIPGTEGIESDFEAADGGDQYDPVCSCLPDVRTDPVCRECHKVRRPKSLESQRQPKTCPECGLLIVKGARTAIGGVYCECPESPFLSPQGKAAGESTGQLYEQLVAASRWYQLQEPDTVRAQVMEDAAAAVAERDALRAGLAEFVDDDPCEFDHHGGCQTHDPNEGTAECMMARARRLLGMEPA